MTDKDHPIYSSDADKTILRPVPGGRKRAAPPVTPRMEQPPAVGELPLEIVSGWNQLVESSLSLLALVPSLRNMASCNNIDALQARMVESLKKFEIQAQQQNFSHTQTRTASYFLCVLLDETVLNTPWGSESGWGHNSLLIQFHGEAWGGEKFFTILNHLILQPANNLALIELAYLCLSLGFEGKFRLASDGRRQIEALRQELYLTCIRLKPAEGQDLSLFWRGIGSSHKPISSILPSWVFALVAAVLLMTAYLGFAYAINRSSNQVFDRLTAIAQEEGKAPTFQPTAPPPPRPETLTRAERFRILLATELAADKVEVPDGNLLLIMNAFPSGSAQIKEEYRPMLEKIAKELQNEPSRIAVIGHTDASPIFTARFPSNWHLSQERAKNVADILASYAPLQERITSEGRAAAEPIASNDTPDGRARNRRIEIRIR